MVYIVFMFTILYCVYITSPKLKCEIIYHYYRLLLRDIHDLKAASGPKGWREQEAKELSEIVQRQLYKLQVCIINVDNNISFQNILPYAKVVHL